MAERITPAPHAVIAPRWRLTLDPKTAAFTLSIQQDAYTVDTTAGAVVATLPAASSVPIGTPFLVEVIAGTNSCTLTPAAGDTVDGGASFSLSRTQTTAAMIVSDGATDWRVMLTRNTAAQSALSLLKSGTVTIGAGAITATTASLGVNLTGKPALACQYQASPDATLGALSVSVNGGDNTRLDIRGTANATALTTIAFWCDAR